MNKKLTGLAALLGAVSLTANANAGNFCGITEDMEYIATEQTLMQLAYSGAYECYDDFCSYDAMIPGAIEEYDDRDVIYDVRVMDSGFANGTNTRCLLDDTIILNRDFLEALHYIARGFAYKKDNPYFDLMTYIRQVGFYANNGMSVPEPCYGCYISDSIADKYERSMQAAALAHEAGHAKYEDYEEQICTQYANAMFFPWDVIGGRLLAMGLSREAENRADRHAAKFLVNHQDDYEPAAGLLWAKLLEAVENPWQGYFPNPFATHPPAFERYSRIRGTLTANGIDVSYVEDAFRMPEPTY